jgi:hypothetical protein
MRGPSPSRSRFLDVGGTSGIVRRSRPKKGDFAYRKQFKSRDGLRPISGISPFDRCAPILGHSADPM